MVEPKKKGIEPGMTVKINFKGMFNFENLYKMILDWLGTRGYQYYPTKGSNLEDYYQEYILSNGAKNNWLWVRTFKNEGDMFTYYIDVDIQILVMTSKEVVHKGEKLKTNEAEITLEIKSYLEVDPDKQWHTTSFLKRAFHLYQEKEFIAIKDDKESDLGEQTVLLFERCKQYLNLMTAMPLQKPFHPELGYPQL